MLKEFWIKTKDIKNLGNDGFLYANCEISVTEKCLVDYDDFKDATHVILKKDYDLLKAKLEKCKEFLRSRCLESYDDMQVDGIMYSYEKELDAIKEIE